MSWARSPLNETNHKLPTNTQATYTPISNDYPKNKGSFPMVANLPCFPVFPIQVAENSTPRMLAVAHFNFFQRNACWILWNKSCFHKVRIDLRCCTLLYTGHLYFSFLWKLIRKKTKSKTLQAQAKRNHDKTWMQFDLKIKSFCEFAEN